MIKKLIPLQLDDRTIRNENDFAIYEFDIVGKLPQRRSKTPTSFAAKNLVSCHLYEYLSGFHVPTYFIEKLNESAMKVKFADEIPFSVSLRNRAIGDFATMYELEEGTVLETPIIDFKLTDKRFEHLFVNESYLCSFGYIEPEEMKVLVKQAGKINAVLKSYFSRRHLELDELTIRFCRIKSQGQIVLGFELSPDTIKLTELEINKKARFDLNENYPLAFYERVIGF